MAGLVTLKSRSLMLALIASAVALVLVPPMLEGIGLLSAIRDLDLVSLILQGVSFICGLLLPQRGEVLYADSLGHTIRRFRPAPKRGPSVTTATAAAE
jgi:hypothetical protein